MSIRIGIDLGTTNSAAAMVYDDGPHVIPRYEEPRVFMPSVVWFRWEGGPDDVVVGDKADNAAAGYEGRVVRSIKRLMGRTFEAAGSERAFEKFHPQGSLQRRHDNDLQVAIPADDGSVRSFWPQEISACILREIKKQVEERLGASIDAAAITVPAYFDDNHRAATLDAARMAGLPVAGPLLDEPTAAALALVQRTNIPPGEPLLVVDWGGGTFDVTVLVNDGDRWYQNRIDGDLLLGGDDLDEELARWVLEQEGLPRDLATEPTAWPHLVHAVRKTKHILSREEVGPFACQLPASGGRKDAYLARRVRRAEFDVLAAPFVKRAMDVVQRCLDHPDVPPDIPRVLLVGGSSYIPLFRARLRELLPRAVHLDERCVNPMDAVALGAAIFAQMDASRLHRICAYGYAIGTGDGNVVEFIGCDQDVPTPEDEPYSPSVPLVTTYDGQTLFRVKLQSFTRAPRGLRQFRPGNEVRVFGRRLPPGRAGTRVHFRYWLDESKILKARARLEGSDEWVEATVSGAETGERAVTTRLTQRMLEAEALVEGNRHWVVPLVAELKAALTRADRVATSGTLEEREEQLSSLEGLLALAATAGGQRDTPDERERILGWLMFYEQMMLPKYGHLLSKDEWADLVEAIRRLRIMQRTEAPTCDLAPAFALLEANVDAAAAAAILKGYRQSKVQGVLPATAARLQAMCDEAEHQLGAGAKAAYRASAAELEAAVEKAWRDWVIWHASRGLNVVSPTLAVKAADE